MENIEKLNPKVKEIEIGIRNFQIIKIYPLSAYDQMRLAGFLSESVAKFLTIAEVGNNLEIVEFIRKMITGNIEEILKMVTDYKEDMLREIDNEQLLTIADIVYDVNFASVLEKNGSKVAEMIRSKLKLTKSSQTSSELIPNTESNTSMDAVIEKAD